MPRRRVAAKRDILPDPKYKSVLLTKLINVLMKNGKKSCAEKIVYGALDTLYKEVGKDFDSRLDKDVSLEKKKIEIFQDVMRKVSPTVEVRSRRVGGATYQIPMEVRQDRGMALAMRWLVKAARSRNEHGMMLRLAREFSDAFHDRGISIKKREETHRMAKANQAFAHFRWN